MKFYALIVAALFAGLSALGNDYAGAALPANAVANAEWAAETFLAYRSAVATYQRNNPGFTGTVSAASLSSQGSQFSQEFLASAGNAITATGTAGRIITAYATLPIGAVSAAAKDAEGDASLGLASGSTWTSFTGGGAAFPLATAVPSGAVVSVIQIGS